MSSVSQILFRCGWHTCTIHHQMSLVCQHNFCQSRPTLACYSFTVHLMAFVVLNTTIPFVWQYTSCIWNRVFFEHQNVIWQTLLCRAIMRVSLSLLFKFAPQLKKDDHSCEQFSVWSNGQEVMNLRSLMDLWNCDPCDLIVIFTRVKRSLAVISFHLE